MYSLLHIIYFFHTKKLSQPVLNNVVCSFLKRTIAALDRIIICIIRGEIENFEVFLIFLFREH